MKETDQEVEWHMPSALSTTVESIVPSFYVVIAPDGHHVDAPRRGRPGVAADPGF